MTGFDSLDEIILSHIVDELDLPGEFEEYISSDMVAKEYDESMRRLASLDEFTTRKLSDEPTYFQKLKGKAIQKAQRGRQVIGTTMGAAGHVALLPPRGAYAVAKFSGEKAHDMAETSLEHIVGAGIVIGYFLKSPNVVLGSSISGLYHGTTAVLSAPAKTPGMISHYFENRRRFRAAKELFDCDESNTFIDVTPQIYDDQTIYSNALPPILVLAGEN